MKTLITGHRLYKLASYDISWIRKSIKDVLEATFLSQTSYGLSGMASGVDLWFCETCVSLSIPYAACVPFEEQGEYMDVPSYESRKILIEKSAAVYNIKNSIMVEKADAGIVVFDGNKGGTHNVFQQLIEKKKPFVWINPVSQKIWECN